MSLLPLATAAWKFRDATTRSPWRPAVVPGCVHRDLLRHQLIPDPFWGTNELGLQWIEEHDWEYRATFVVPAALLAEDVVELVADGLDTVAIVTLNGHEVARTENMFLGYRWDVKRWLKRGRNQLTIRFGSAMHYIRRTRPGHVPREFNDPVGRCVVIRKQQCQFGWDWGPRLVTAGVWRDIRIEGWTGNRLDSVRVTQRHERGRVRLELAPELARAAQGVTLRWQLGLANVGPASDARRRPRRGRNGRPAVVSQPAPQTGEGTVIEVTDPQLWWPNGQGAQPLYELAVEAVDQDGRSLGAWRRRIGLRTIVLDQHKDQWGESFQFVVNGRAVFAKGANWIPAHSYVAGLTRADYERDLRSAAEAHMNMIRIWGGGIYESEDFHDLCDQLGLMVWQDFMFACTRYPADEAFLASSQAEVIWQSRRLRHRASLALWCGNNEVFGCNLQELVNDARKYAEYEALFHRAIPDALRMTDAVTAYWPSSPWRGDTAGDHESGTQRGDTHYWDVWHARHPVKDYEKHVFRFASEFGMQSYSSEATNATFCPPHADNVFGPEMENHQKNRFGNQIILDYVSRLYRFPKDQSSLVYLSQLNQATCMQVGVEHYRRNRPRCMGALYWQLNDCWPVASWSSIEFTGRWKALHYVARRFFAPAIVTAQLAGDETTIISNYRRSTVDALVLFTVSDAPAALRGRLGWEVWLVQGRRLARGGRAVTLAPGASVRQQRLDLNRWIARHGRDALCVRLRLDTPLGASEETVFLTAPRFVELPRAKTTVRWERQSATRVRLTFTSDAFQHRFAFAFGRERYRATDNFFDLYPGEPRSVTVEFERAPAAARARRALTHRSLVDSY
jgi:beta-mannosidase